jgi:hypothetical protein
MGEQLTGDDLAGVRHWERNWIAGSRMRSALGATLDRNSQNVGTGFNPSQPDPPHGKLRPLKIPRCRHCGHRAIDKEVGNRPLRGEQQGASGRGQCSAEPLAHRPPI